MHSFYYHEERNIQIPQIMTQRYSTAKTLYQVNFHLKLKVYSIFRAYAVSVSWHGIAWHSLNKHVGIARSLPLMV